MKKIKINKVDMLDVWYPTFPNEHSLVEIEVSDDFVERFDKARDAFDELQKEIETAKPK